MQIQVDAQRMDLGQEGNQVLKAAPEAVHAPSHNHIEFPSRCRSAQRIESRALVSAISTADAVVAISLNDLDAHAFGHGLKLALLVGCVLVGGADAKI